MESSDFLVNDIAQLALATSAIDEAESRCRGERDLADGYEALCIVLEDENSVLRDRVKNGELQMEQIRGRLTRLNNKNTTLARKLRETILENEEMQLNLTEACNSVTQKQKELDDWTANMESIAQVVFEDARDDLVALDEDNDHPNLAAIEEQMRASEDSSQQTELVQAKESLEVKVRELENTIEMEQEKLTCQVCYDNKRNVVCLPCKHFLFCSVCLRGSRESDEADRCPVCQTAITGVLDVYM